MKKNSAPESGKWYQQNVNMSSILSSRVRLARNFKKYAFPLCITDTQRLSVMEETARALASYGEKDSLNMLRIDMMERTGRFSLIDKHLISPNFANETKPASVFVSNSDKISIMVLEEDHIRIQAIEAGGEIDAAHEKACLLDDILDDAIEYAYDENLGYLTSCPTNVGTGLRASFMLHIPYLEANGQIADIARAISKFGYTIRGTFGEGSEACGSVYQISNQVTLGLSESEILNNIKSLTSEIVFKEHDLAQKDLKANRLLIEDRVWRNFGILTNARVMSEKEAIGHLSVLKLGVANGIITAPLLNIYELIINIRDATLAEKYKLNDKMAIMTARADYLRKMLNG